MYEMLPPPLECRSSTIGARNGGTSPLKKSFSERSMTGSSAPSSRTLRRILSSRSTLTPSPWTIQILVTAPAPSVSKITPSPSTTLRKRESPSEWRSYCPPSGATLEERMVRTPGRTEAMTPGSFQTSQGNAAPAADTGSVRANTTTTSATLTPNDLIQPTPHPRITSCPLIPSPPVDNPRPIGSTDSTLSRQNPARSPKPRVTTD